MAGVRMLFMAFFLAVAGVAPAGADGISLRADAWCPYNCQPDSPKPGYAVELAKAIFEPRGIRVDYQLQPWSRALEETRGGRVDAVVGANAEEANGLVVGAEPLGISANVLLSRRADGFAFDGIASLAGRRLAVVQDYSYGRELDAFLAAAPAGQVEVTKGDDVSLRNITMLMGKRVDLVLEDRNVAGHVLAENGMSGLVEMHGATPGTPLFIAFSPKHPKAAEYARILDQGIRELRASGRLAAILGRYGLTDWVPQVANR